jgi:uncharacterized membrane protein
MVNTPSIVRSLKNQRRALLMAGLLVIASIWISLPLGEWQNGLFLAIGIVLGAVNHVLTEHVLLRSVEAGDLPTRKQYAASSLFRLLGISLVAVALTAFFWPHGAAVLFGLAIFHLIALVLTGIPLLKEVRKA